MAVPPSYSNRIQDGASQDCGPLVLTTNPAGALLALVDGAGIGSDFKSAPLRQAERRVLARKFGLVAFE